MCKAPFRGLVGVNRLQGSTDYKSSDSSQDAEWGVAGAFRETSPSCATLVVEAIHWPAGVGLRQPPALRAPSRHHPHPHSAPRSPGSLSGAITPGLGVFVQPGYPRSLLSPRAVPGFTLSQVRCWRKSWSAHFVPTLSSTNVCPHSPSSCVSCSPALSRRPCVLQEAMGQCHGLPRAPVCSNPSPLQVTRLATQAKVCVGGSCDWLGWATWQLAEMHSSQSQASWRNRVTGDPTPPQ